MNIKRLFPILLIKFMLLSVPCAYATEDDVDSNLNPFAEVSFVGFGIITDMNSHINNKISNLDDNKLDLDEFQKNFNKSNPDVNYLKKYASHCYAKQYYLKHKLQEVIQNSSKITDSDIKMLKRELEGAYLHVLSDYGGFKYNNYLSAYRSIGFAIKKLNKVDKLMDELNDNKYK